MGGGFRERRLTPAQKRSLGGIRRSRWRSRTRYRATRRFSWKVLLFGLGLLCFGVFQTFRNPLWTYPNYWGGAVFAPLVAALGVLLMLASPFVLVQSRPHGDAAGPQVRFPHQEAEAPWTPTDRNPGA